MKNVFVFLLIGALGCSDRIRIYADHESDFDGKEYSTFGWSTILPAESDADSIYNNELMNRKMRFVIQKQLELRGYDLTVDAPDFKVYFHFTIHDQSMISPDLFDLDENRYRTRTRMDHPALSEGTLVLGVIDAKTNNLEWRGWAVCSLDQNATPDEKDELIGKALYRIFRKFPNTSKHTFVRDDKI